MAGNHKLLLLLEAQSLCKAIHNDCAYRKTERIIPCTEGKSGEDTWYKEAGTKLIVKP